MKKLNQQQKRELRKAFDTVFHHEQSKVIANFLFNRDQLLNDAWSAFQDRKDFVFEMNANPLTVHFSHVPPLLVFPTSFASAPSVVSSAASEVEPKRKGRGAGKKQPKQVTSFALEPDLMAALNERAEREERTVSALIRLAIKRYLEDLK